MKKYLFLLFFAAACNNLSEPARVKQDTITAPSADGLSMARMEIPQVDTLPRMNIELRNQAISRKSISFDLFIGQDTATYIGKWIALDLYLDVSAPVDITPFRTGPYRFIEIPVTTNKKYIDFASVVDLDTGLWQNRHQQAFKISVLSGMQDLPTRMIKVGRVTLLSPDPRNVKSVIRVQGTKPIGSSWTSTKGPNVTTQYPIQLTGGK